MSSNNSPWYVPPLLFGLRITHSFRAMIAHEDKPGVFKFVWYSSRQFRHVSFLVVNNGFFVDGNVRKVVFSDLFFSVRLAPHCLQLFPKLSGLISHIQAHAPYEPMHPSAPSFSVTLDARLMQLTVSISCPSFFVSCCLLHENISDSPGVIASKTPSYS